jgi:hypothetical protein
MSIVSLPPPPEAPIAVASTESVVAHFDDGEIGAVILVVVDEDVQEATAKALIAIDSHSTELRRQGIDSTRQGRTAYQLASMRRNELMRISWELVTGLVGTASPAG